MASSKKRISVASRRERRFLLVARDFRSDATRAGEKNLRAPRLRLPGYLLPLRAVREIISRKGETEKGSRETRRKSSGISVKLVNELEASRKLGFEIFALKRNGWGEREVGAPR